MVNPTPSATVIPLVAPTNGSDANTDLLVNLDPADGNFAQLLTRELAALLEAGVGVAKDPLDPLASAVDDSGPPPDALAPTDDVAAMAALIPWLPINAAPVPIDAVALPTEAGSQIDANPLRGAKGGMAPDMVRERQDSMDDTPATKATATATALNAATAHADFMVKQAMEAQLGASKTTQAVAVAAADAAPDARALAATMPAQAQPAPVIGTQHAVQASVEPRVDNPRFGEALAQQVVWMAKENHQVAALRLDPPDLGPLQVTLTINNDQATAAFFSSHESVRDAVEASAPRLREMLAEAGLTLTGFSVATQSQQGGREYGGNRRRSADAADLAQELALPPGGVNPLRGGRGLVDTFA